MYNARKKGFELYPVPRENSGGTDALAKERAAYIRGYEDAYAYLHTLTYDQSMRLFYSFVSFVRHGLKTGTESLNSIGATWLRSHCTIQERAYESLPFKGFLARADGGIKLFAVNEESGLLCDNPDERHSYECGVFSLPEGFFPLMEGQMVEVELFYGIVDDKKDYQNEA